MNVCVDTEVGGPTVVHFSLTQVFRWFRKNIAKLY